jgi:hypothetical protein
MSTRKSIVGADYYTAGETKQILGITNGILYNYADNGTLEKVYPPGSKQAVYKKSQVDQLARELHSFTGARKKKPTQFKRVETREEMMACQEISQALFSVGRNTVDDRMQLLQKNPDTYHLLQDEDQIIGYAAVMPLKPGRLDDVLRQEIPVKIAVEDLEDFSTNRTIDVYLHAMGVKPGFSAGEKHAYGARLVSGIMDLLIQWGNQGVQIQTIAARSNMPDGLRLMKHMGFTEIIPYTPDRRTFVIDVQLSAIPFILAYKKALEGAKGK